MPLLKKLHFLPIRQRISFKICLLVSKCINNIAPNYLKDMLKLREQKRRSSRLDDDYFRLKVPPRPNFSRSEGAFSYIGPNSPVISCHGEGTTEWQRFEGSNMFIRVPIVTVPKFQKIPLKENMLQRF